MIKESQKLKNFFFFSSYIIYITFEILINTFYSPYFFDYTKIITIICILLLVCKEIAGKSIKKKDLFFLIICFIMSFILLIRYKNGFDFIILFLLIFSARDISFEKILKCTAILESFLFIFVFISAKLGIITDYIEYEDRIRDYMGFIYSLFPQMLVANISFIIMYLNKDSKNKLFIGLLLILLNYLVFIYTDSRLSFYSTLLLIFIIVILYNHKKIYLFKLLKWISIFSFFICCIFSFYITNKYDYKDANLEKINLALDGRLANGKKSFSKYKINLLGHDVNFVGNGFTLVGNNLEKVNGVQEYNYVDNFYISVTEKYGIVFFTIYLLLFTFTIYYSYKKKDYILALILVIMALHGLIDDLLLHIYYNTFYFAISYMISEHHKDLILKSKNMERKE